MVVSRESRLPRGQLRLLGTALWPPGLQERLTTAAEHRGAVLTYMLTIEAVQPDTGQTLTLQCAMIGRLEPRAEAAVQQFTAAQAADLA